MMQIDDTLSAQESQSDDSASTANVGVRYFPGATMLGGGWNRMVAVVGETDPPTAGVTVYLKSFDVGDSSFDEAPVDENGADGGDNRDSEGGDFGTTVGGLPVR
jgi:hypothetical protein